MEERITARTPWEKNMDGVPMHLDYFDGTAYEAVKKIADAYPDSIAFDFMGRATSYRRMIGQIERCARSLRTIGVRAGDRVTIAANVLFKDYNPQFQDGMRIVTPIRADQNNTSRTYFGTEGTYYVTPDGYAISAFEEDAASYAAAPSGLRVETLLEKLKEMQK